MTKLQSLDNLQNESTRLFADILRNFSNVQSIVVTGCENGVGVTSLCIALARSVARLRHAKVLVVDANFRASTLTKTANANGAKGLRDLVAGGAAFGAERLDLADFVVPFGSDIMILPVGTKTGIEMVDLDSAGVLGALHEKLTAEYDFILWDTDTVNHSTDTKVLMANVPDVILVTQSDETRIDHMVSSLNEIKSLKRRLVAILRNQAGRTFLGVGADQE